MKDELRFPRKYKIAFLELIGGLFNDNGYYSRSEYIVSIFKNMYETCSEDEKREIAYKYAIFLASRTYDIWSTGYETAEEYTAFIKGIVADHDLTTEQSKHLEFKLTRVWVDYCSIVRLVDGAKYHHKLMEIAKEMKSIFLTNE